ncbi:hypothetical protein [Parasediminibacterium sp. JCM 36343]|uniref:hypothetical protein n=1 Tax=Parasediminibacterium sp. JCM 36343 TaxID=3374279 RepID=UPI00397A2C42
MKIIYPGFISILLLTFASCMDIKSVSKGALAKNDYTYSYFKFYKKGGHLCTVYDGQIEDKKEVAKEKIVYYSCLSQTPFKVVYTLNENKSLTVTGNFVAVTDSSFAIAATEEEKQLFAIMASHKMPGDYGNYADIKGFRIPTKEDNIDELPFLKQAKNPFYK